MAQSQVAKRLNIAGKAVLAATQLVDALVALQELKDEHVQAGGVLDSDFDGTDLNHLTAGMVNVLFDDVVTSLVANYLDATNGGRNKQILLQVRR